MFALARFESQIALTQEAQEIKESLNEEQQKILLEDEDSYKTLTKEIILASFSTWELAVKALGGYEGEAIKNTVTGEYFGVEVLCKCQ